MKLKHTLLYISCFSMSLMACSDKEYVSNDPDAAPNAPACYDVNDQKLDYSVFYNPSHGWIGDPMPFYKDGKFYVYYLQDTRPAGDTFHPWFLATTTDLINYTDEGEVIACGEDKSQEDALGTGSVFEHNGTYYAFYTAHNGDLSPKEKIYLATSVDLITWTKQPSFSLEAPASEYDRNEFRDPTIIEENGVFKMLLSTRANYNGSWRAVIAQYSSTDLLNWTLETPFYDDPSTFMLECPDVFTMGNYQYLIYSNIDDYDRRVHYRYRQTGTSEWITPERSPLDGSYFYAGKTASDGTDRYLFAWCPTRDNYKDSGNKSWGGSLAVHKLVQKADGTLDVVIPATIDNKVSNASNPTLIDSRDKETQSNSYTIDGTYENPDYILFDRITGISKITTTIDAGSARQFGFEFGACGNRREVYSVMFNIYEGGNTTLEMKKVLRLAGTTDVITTIPLPVPSDNKYKVTIFIENSVCTVYVNDQIALTNRIYKMNDNPWGIFSNDGSATFSDLKLYK